MPLYEFECKCGYVFEEFRKLELYEQEVKCKQCGGLAQLVFKPLKVKMFKVQDLHGVCTEKEYKPTIVRNKQDVIDAMHRFNDSEVASKQGKVTIAE